MELRNVAAADLPSVRVPELVAKFETRAAARAAVSFETGSSSLQNMQRASKDLVDGSGSSYSGSESASEPEKAIAPPTVSADDGAQKQAALRVDKDLAGVPIPEVTSAAALSSAATASISSTPLAAGQLTGGASEQTAPQPGSNPRLSSALLEALDAQTNAPQKATAASLAVQSPGSRRGSGDSVAEPLPASAYREKPQPSRFAAKPPPASDGGESIGTSSSVEAQPMTSAGQAARPATALGLLVNVKDASTLRTESDMSQDAGGTPLSARALLTGPSSATLAAAPGSVTVSPKGSVIGFMPLPAAFPHPLQPDDTQVDPHPFLSVPGHASYTPAIAAYRSAFAGPNMLVGI